VHKRRSSLRPVFEQPGEHATVPGRNQQNVLPDLELDAEHHVLVPQDAGEREVASGERVQLMHDADRLVAA